MLLFVAAAIGWLALMLAEGRERLVWVGPGAGTALDQATTTRSPTTPPEPLGVVGRRIGAAAVGLALILPALMPWAGSGLFKSSGGGSGANGSGSGGTVSALNPVDELGGFLTRKSEVTLMKFTTDDTDPDYFRVITLDSFDGSKWKPAQQRAAGDVPAAAQHPGARHRRQGRGHHGQHPGTEPGLAAGHLSGRVDRAALDRTTGRTTPRRWTSSAPVATPRAARRTPCRAATSNRPRQSCGRPAPRRTTSSARTPTFPTTSPRRCST